MAEQTPVETVEAPADVSVLFTDAAAAKVSELIAEEGNPNLKLRISVAGRRMLRPPIQLRLRRILGSDRRGLHPGYRNAVDRLAKPPYLKGAEIDYAEDLEGSRFVIKNPNATSTCRTSFCV